MTVLSLSRKKDENMDVSEKKFIEVGNRLKLLRGNLSQNEMAGRFGMTLRSYQRYEAGERVPPMVVLGKIAKDYKTTVDWLLTGEEPMIRKPDIPGAQQKEIDFTLMKEVIESVEGIFQKQRLHLSPRKKAELIILLYEEIFEDESRRTVLSQRALKLIRLAL